MSQGVAAVGMLRRSFLTALGLAAGGLALGLGEAAALGDELSAVTPALPNPRDPAAAVGIRGLRPNWFVHVLPDGMVTLVCHRSEMGQGIRSSLPVLLADELGASMAQVKVVQADGDARYGDQNTDGSSSVRNQYDDLRLVAATAREMLIAAAAARWNVARESCTAVDHRVVHRASKRRLGFGELAEAAGKLPIPEPAQVKLRPKSELRHVGTALPLLDGVEIVTGRAMFGADLRLPGMLTAVIARPPVVGGKVLRFDATRALAIPGVKRVVELPAPKPPYGFQPFGGVAVIADTTWAALRGRAALAVVWDGGGSNAAYDSAAYRERLLATVRQPGKVVRRVGDVTAALGAAAQVVEAEYYVPHLAHVPMEPPVALARATAKGCEIWAPTQNPQAARTEAARMLGVDERQVTVHVTLLGGAFGRKGKADFVAEAAWLSHAVGAPVRVQWTREDDVRHDYYHMVSAQRLSAGLDARGKVTAWQHRTAFPPIASTFADTGWPGEGELQQGVLDVPLAVPNVRAESAEAKAYVRIGWLRSVCNIHHAFAINSFMDEIAHARGDDPRAVMLEIFGPARLVSLAELGVPKLLNYGQPLDRHPIDVGRMRRVIERVTALSGWAKRKKKGRALGLAAHRSFLSYAAVVVSVVRDAAGKIHVDEVWLAADAGTLLSTDRVHAQMEGAVLFGMSIALHGEVTMKAGATEQSSFRDYRIARIGEAPRAIHVEMVKNDGPPGGVGEPGVPPVAPAIANAVFALTGLRVRELPLSRAGLV